MSAPRVAGLVLAAGLSSRMQGEEKLLLPYGGDTVVRAAVRAALDADLTPVVAVTGHRSEEVRRALSGTGARIVENPEFRSGMGSSLAAGVRVLAREADVEGVAVLLGDEPGMRSETIRDAVAAWRASPASVLRTRYLDRPGHPVLFPRDAFPVLASLRGDSGPADLLAAGAAEVAWLEVDRPAPVDVDTAETYREALEARERAGS